MTPEQLEYKRLLRLYHLNIADQNCPTRILVDFEEELDALWDNMSDEERAELV